MASSARLASRPGLGLLLCVFAVVANATLPYTPTRLFLSSPDNSTTTKDLIYQLDPPSPSWPQGALRSLSLDQDLNPNNLPFKTVSSSLPFLSKDSTLASLSAANINGTISVYVGNCAADASTSALWRYSTADSSGAAQSSWVQLSIDESGSQTQAAANFLASSILFSPTTLQENESMYIFGGMCPDGTAAESDWTTSAQYSNQLVQMSPENAGDKYSRQVLEGLGQPIAEAGFTMTPLAPAVASSGQGALTQQQSFLLLGGHTQAAFLNMSQVALFSLPEASWTFIPIQTASGKTDLKGRTEPLHVEPRSGHTAVLSADGSQVIVVGGWVGDVSTPAEPQMAVLEIGQGYGGTAAGWSWGSGTSKGTPFDDGSGIYGHGAVMLPGNIMMVSGGFSIPVLSGNTKRANQQVSNKVLFFNVTSGSFLSSYSIHLANKSSLMSLSSIKGPLETASQKAGLGVGLGLGIVAVALACLFAWMYWRRRQKSQGQETSYDKVFSGQQLDSAPMEEKHGAAQFTERNVTSNMRAQEYSQNSWAHLRDADRTGLDVDVPSPNRGLRKGRGPLNSHLTDHSESRAEFTLRAISPIDEQPEHDRIPSGSSREHMQKALDPFRDPEPPSLHEARRVNFQLLPGISSHVQRHDLPHTGQGHGTTGLAGRTSPDKSTRTTSTLSEQSRSGSDTRRHSYGPRSTSHDMDPFVSPVTSRAASIDLSVESNSDKRTESFRNGQSSSSAQLSSSERTTQDVMAESQRLLGKPNRLSLPSRIQIPESRPRRQSVVSPITPDTKPTFTITRKDSQQGHAAARYPGRALGSTRLGSWVGSVRRGLAYPSHGYQRSASMNSVSAANYLSNNYHNPTGGFVDADQYTEEISASCHSGRSSSSSPTKLTAPIHKIRRKQVPTDTSDGVAQRPVPRRVMSDSSGQGYWFLGGLSKDDPIVAAHELDEDEAADSDPHDIGRGLLGNSQVDVQHDDHTDIKGPSPVVADVAKRHVLHAAPYGRLRVVNRGDEDGYEDDDDDDDGGQPGEFIVFHSETPSHGNTQSSPASATRATGRVGLQVRRIERARQQGTAAER